MVLAGFERVAVVLRGLSPGCFAFHRRVWQAELAIANSANGETPLTA